jgi:hypothetical protein
MIWRRRLVWLAGLGLIVHAGAVSPYWARLGAAAAHDGLDYAQRREAYGFEGFSIRSAAAALDAHLARDVPVRLSPPLLRNDFFRQRISEGLHPRSVDSSAWHTLRLAPRERFDASRSTAIAPLGAEGILYLQGVLPGRDEPEPAREGFALDARALLLAACATLGLGGAVGLALRRRIGLDAVFLPPLLAPLAALVVGLVATGASWIQSPVSPRACGWIGLALLPATAWFAMRDARLRGALESAARGALRCPETWALALLLASFVALLAAFPIVGWDGRSIWLFQAKRLFFDGILTVRAATDPDAAWSHTSYPLLLPAWMAFSTAFSAVYNERLIGIGVAVLFVSELACVWILARLRLGRWPGSAFTMALALGLAPLTAQGFADGHLTLLLVVQLLAGLGGAAPVLAWVAALAASLVKLEGLVLAIGVAAVCALLAPPPRAARARRSLVAWLVFMPAALHIVWSRAWGLAGDFEGIHWGGVWAELPARVSVVIRAFPALLAEGPLLVEASVGLSWVAVAHLVGRRTPARAEAAALLVAAGCTAFALSAMVVTPKDVEWHVSNALGRLLLHPAAFLVLAALLLGRAKGSEGSSRGGALRGSSSASR